MVSDFKTQMWFGKHKGKTVEVILDTDPNWLIWAHEKTVLVRLTPELLDMAQNAAAVTRKPDTSWEKIWGFNSPLFDDETERERDRDFSGLWDK